MSDKVLPFGRHEPEMTADEVDGLLRGLPPAASASPAAHAVGEALGFMSTPPSRTELANERAVVALFALSTRMKELPATDRADVEGVRRARRRGFRVAIAAAAGSVVLGGVAAAAIGVLPGSTASSEPTVSVGTASAGAHPATTASPPTPHHTARASASADASTGGNNQSKAGTLIGTVTPAIDSVCTSVLTGVTPTLPAGQVTQILSQLKATAAAGGQTLSQLCTRLTSPSVSPTPTGAGASGPSVVLPVPSLGPLPGVTLPEVTLPTVTLPRVTLPPVTLH